MGELLRQEGGGRRVSNLLYRVVVHTVLLFGLESWVMSDAMMKSVDGTHMGFLRQITRKQARRKADRAWGKPVSDEILRAMCTQLTSYAHFWRSARGRSATRVR